MDAARNWHAYPCRPAVERVDQRPRRPRSLQCNLCTNTYTNRYRRSNTHSHPVPHSHPNAYPISDAYPYRNSDTISNTDSVANANSNGYSNWNTNPDSYRNSNAGAHA